jgi:hypothetical protein
MVIPVALGEVVLGIILLIPDLVQGDLDLKVILEDKALKLILQVAVVAEQVVLVKYSVLLILRLNVVHVVDLEGNG